MEAKFNEQVFYHDGDNSSFLTAIKLSSDGLTLSKFSQVDQFKTLDIEFSFPNSEIIVKNKVLIQDKSNYPFLKFSNLDKKSKDAISKYISSFGPSLNQPTL